MLPVLWLQDHLLRCWVSNITVNGNVRYADIVYSVYFITNTLQIPAGTQMVGEAWTVIMGGGSAFSNMNSPTVMVQVGAPGSQGIMEITDILFTTQGPGQSEIFQYWVPRVLISFVQHLARSFLNGTSLLPLRVVPVCGTLTSASVVL